jgi:hypothetical protein
MWCREHQPNSTEQQLIMLESPRTSRTNAAMTRDTRRCRMTHRHVRTRHPAYHYTLKWLISETRYQTGPRVSAQELRSTHVPADATSMHRIHQRRASPQRYTNTTHQLDLHMSMLVLQTTAFHRVPASRHPCRHHLPTFAPRKRRTPSFNRPSPTTPLSHIRVSMCTGGRTTQPNPTRDLVKPAVADWVAELPSPVAPTENSTANKEINIRSH